MTTVFVDQPLALPWSAKYGKYLNQQKVKDFVRNHVNPEINNCL